MAAKQHSTPNPSAEKRPEVDVTIWTRAVLGRVSTLAEHPDAALILAGHAHRTVHAAMNAMPDDDWSDEHPLVVEYRRLLDFFDNAEPKTAEGWFAKAHAARLEAWSPISRMEDPDSIELEWAWDLVAQMTKGFKPPS